MLSFIHCDKLKTKVARGWNQQSAKLQMVSEQLGYILFTNPIHKNKKSTCYNVSESSMKLCKILQYPNNVNLSVIFPFILLSLCVV